MASKLEILDIPFYNWTQNKSTQTQRDLPQSLALSKVRDLLMLPNTLEKICDWARDGLIHLYYSSEVPSWIADCSIPSLGEGNIESPHLNSKTYEPANKIGWA